MVEKIKDIHKFNETNETNTSLLKWLYNKIKKSIDKTKKSDNLFNSLDGETLKVWEEKIININGKQIWFILDNNNRFTLNINGEKTVLTWIWKVVFKKDGLECVKLISWLNKKDEEKWDNLDISSMLKDWKWELKYNSILDILTKSK